jgi:hypothetical protein
MSQPVYVCESPEKRKLEESSAELKRKLEAAE